MPEEALEAPREERKVLITGATGFLGKYAVSEFVHHGYRVIASGRNKEALQRIEQPGVEVMQGSIDDLSKTTFDADIVVHAAALSSPWGKWQDFYKNNVLATNKMIKFAQKNSVKKFVYVSSPSIYSSLEHRYDISEEDYDAENKLNHYIRSKILAETALRGAFQSGDLQGLTILRPRGLIGVGDNSLVPRLMRANERTGIPLFNKGYNTVDITCVENVALALRLASESPKADGQTYNITNGEPRSFRSIVDDFFEAIGKKPRYKHFPIKPTYLLASMVEKVFELSKTGIEPPLTRYLVATLAFSQTLDISKACNDLKYKPYVSLDEGIKNFGESFRGTNGITNSN